MKTLPHPSVVSSLTVTLAVALLVGVIYLLGHFYNKGQSVESAISSAARLTGYGTPRPVPDIMADIKKAQETLAVEQAKLVQLQATLGNQPAYSPQVFFEEQARVDLVLKNVAAERPSQPAGEAKLLAANQSRDRAAEALSKWKAVLALPSAQQNAQAIQAAAQNYAQAAAGYAQSLSEYVASLPAGTPPQAIADLNNQISALNNTVATINSNPSGNPATQQQIQTQQDVVSQLNNQVNDLQTELVQTQNQTQNQGQTGQSNQNPAGGTNSGSGSGTTPFDWQNNIPVPPPGPPCIEASGIPCLIQGANREY